MANKKPKIGTKNNSRGSLVTGAPIDLLGTSNKSRQTSAKISPAGDLRKISNLTGPATNPISFGKPSNSGAANSASGSGVDWTSLLGKTSSGGASKLLGGGILSFGIDALFSGVADLFGGEKKAPEPLIRFSLPDSQNETIYSGSGAVSRTRGESASVIRSGTGSYSSPSDRTSQAAIVKAVKNALLTSSSLNDIIGEL